MKYLQVLNSVSVLNWTYVYIASVSLSEQFNVKSAQVPNVCAYLVYFMTRRSRCLPHVSSMTLDNIGDMGLSKNEAFLHGDGSKQQLYLIQMKRSD